MAALRAKGVLWVGEAVTVRAQTVGDRWLGVRAMELPLPATFSAHAQRGGMLLFTLSAFLLLLTIIAAPIALAVLGVRQLKWWRNERQPALARQNPRYA
jgi:hypothetical protein